MKVHLHTLRRSAACLECAIPVLALAAPAEQLSLGSHK